MVRFLAFTWDPSVESQAQCAKHLEERLRTKLPWSMEASCGGLIVYSASTQVNAMEAHPLFGGAGTVLGTAFRRIEDDRTVAEKAVFDRFETAAIISTHGLHLIESYWGRYVAFMYDSARRRSCILRDPTGAVPCLTATLGPLTLYFSDISDVDSLGLREFRINWDYMYERLIVPWRLEARETGLSGVSTVSAGECVTHEAGQVQRTFLWNPFEIAQSSPVRDLSTAATTLRKAVLTSIHTWASQHTKILHSLSGGFDSSLVLSCLRSAPTRPEVECFTYYSVGRDDERKFARAIAEYNGFPLVERCWSSDVDLRRFLTISKSASPTMYLQWLEMGHSDAELARVRGATAIFGGQGGDQLFVQRCIDRTPIDYVHDCGLRFGLFRISLSAALQENISIWPILRTAFLYGLRHRCGDPRAEALPNMKLVAADVIETAKTSDRFAHPWFGMGCRAGPGKLDQIHSLAFPIEFYNPFGDLPEIDRILPLLSQPLIEACLRIPTYVLTHGGNDRALARHAFSDYLPPLIRRRHGKGRVDEHVKEIVLKNIDAIRELLLDGCLVQRRFLNRDKLEQALSGGPTAVRSGLLEILDHLSTEAWLRSWSSQPAPCPA